MRWRRWLSRLFYFVMYRLSWLVTIRDYFKANQYPLRHERSKLSKNYFPNKEFARIYHYHIRKTGGTSFNEAVSNAVGAEYPKGGHRRIQEFLSRKKIISYWNRYLLQQGHYFYGHSHWPAHTLNLPENTYTVTILRDPIKRLLSYYKHIVHYTKDLTGGLPYYLETSWYAPTFREFYQQLPGFKLMNQLFMFSANLDTQEAVKNARNVSILMFLDDIDSGLRQFKKDTGLKLKMPHTRKSKLSIKPTKQEEEELGTILKPEYDFYYSLRQES